MFTLDAAPDVAKSTIEVETFVDGSASEQVSGVAVESYHHWLKTWLTNLVPEFSPINAYEVSLRLTDDAEIQQFNTDYRQQPKPTDVLSFAAIDDEVPGIEGLYHHQPFYLGDIIISVETAARQAPIHQHSLAQEVAWLTAHGLLHLLGWDHPDEDSLVHMLDRQNQLMGLIEI